MKYVFAVACLLGLASCQFTVNVDPGSSGGGTGSGTGGGSGAYIVVLQAQSATDPDFTASELIATHQGTKKRVFRRALSGFSADLTSESLAAMKQDPRVRYVVPDHAFRGFADTLPTGVDRVNAEKNKTAVAGNVDVDIAILDTGVQSSHPDLNVYRSVNLATGESDLEDKNGHGTHVAGTAAAKADGQGVIGIAPGARLWSVKVLDANGSGYLSDVIAGVDYVTLHASEIDVVNVSLGGSGADDGNCGKTNQDPLHEAICASVAAGVVYVVAAGNDASDAAATIPAAYDEVITVSAIADSDGNSGGKGSSTTNGADDTFARFSNFGADVDIAAPGVNILSTYLGGKTATLSGTSMATPHVAGAAALYIRKNGKPTNKAGVLAVRAGLVALAFARDSADGFTQDRDLLAEPLLDVEAIEPVTGTVPALLASVATDKASYQLPGESSAVVAVSVKDENGLAVTGLASGDFTTRLDGSLTSIGFLETEPGVYRAVLPLSSLAAGTHALKVTVRDGSLVADATTSFAVTGQLPSSPVALHVASISYLRTGDRELQITVQVRDQRNVAVSGASIILELFYDGGNYYGTGTKTTGADGRVTFTASSTPRFHCYWARVLRASKPGLPWDTLADSADSGFCQ